MEMSEFCKLHITGKLQLIGHLELMTLEDAIALVNMIVVSNQNVAAVTGSPDSPLVDNSDIYVLGGFILIHNLINRKIIIYKINKGA